MKNNINVKFKDGNMFFILFFLFLLPTCKTQNNIQFDKEHPIAVNSHRTNFREDYILELICDSNRFFNLIYKNSKMKYRSFDDPVVAVLKYLTKKKAYKLNHSYDYSGSLYYSYSYGKSIFKIDLMHILKLYGRKDLFNKLLSKKYGVFDKVEGNEIVRFYGLPESRSFPIMIDTSILESQVWE